MKPDETKNSALQVVISKQSAAILEKLARLGVYGVTPEEIAARFIDAGVLCFVEPPRFDGAGMLRKQEAKSE